jgi:zinc/manganese transport system permease protein
MTLATLFGFVAAVAGLLVSYHANLPSGPAIVLAAGSLYGISLAVAAASPRLASILRRRA